MPNDKDAQEERTQPEPLDAFHDALAELWIECHQLCIAASRNDYEDAEIAANDAVACWLSAFRVLQQLELHADHRGALELWEAHRVLDDLFAWLKKQVDLPSLGDALGQLRIHLAQAKSKRPRARPASPQ